MLIRIWAATSIMPTVAHWHVDIGYDYSVFVPIGWTEWPVCSCKLGLYEWGICPKRGKWGKNGTKMGCLSTCMWIMNSGVNPLAREEQIQRREVTG